jgi:signal transduction histidine kinase
MREDKSVKYNLDIALSKVVLGLGLYTHPDLDFRLDIEELPDINGYPELISLALHNIVQNALQAIAERKGSIVIRAYNESNNVCVLVKDTGVGISQGNISRIFEPFFTTRAVGQGMGLGLAIAHGIIQKHNGSITVQSVENEGSEFLVRIPLSV